MKADSLTMTIPEVAKALGCSRNIAYQLARQNKLPVPVIYIGEKRMVVSRRVLEGLMSDKLSNTVSVEK